MRLLGRLLALIVVLSLVCGAVFYARPLWMEQQGTHFSLLWNHVQSDYVLTASGYRVHYYDAEPRFAPGHGTPLVLIHGLADRSESWAPQLERLKRAGFHVYALDLLGYGRSPKPDNGDYSISGEEQFVAEFIQAIGLQRPDIGGWSMGGWIAMKLALDHPEMANRLVIYDAAGIRTNMPDPKDSFDIKTPDDVNRLVSVMEPGAKPLPNFVAKDAVRRFESNQATTQRNMAAMKTGKDLLDDRMPQLTVPLLIVWGSEDRLTPLAMGRTIHGMVKGSELDIVEGCGHLAPIYCAGRVASATADFLKANPVPTGGERTLVNMAKTPQ